MATTAAPAATSGQPGGPGGRPQIKVGSNPNMNRRGMQSPVDGGANKRNTPHKPWGQQSHSGQQKYQVSNAINNQKKATETDTPDKHMNDRTVYLLANCVGRKVTATIKSGAQFQGVYTGSAMNGDFGCVLKFAKQTRGPQGEEDQIVAGYIGGGPEKVLIIEGKDLMDLEVPEVPLESSEVPTNQNGTGQFKTDVDISGNQPIRERELQRWQADDTGLGGGLEETGDTPAPEKKWDQFETNERLFGLKSDFDENIYTTKIDTSHPMHKQREAAAAKIAREIETNTGSGANLSAHQAEERGLKVDDSGVDEEDKYSSVQRAPSSGGIPASGTQKYMPPALRAQVSAPASTSPTSKEVPKEAPKEPAAAELTPVIPVSEPSPSTQSSSKPETNPKKPIAATPAVPIIPVITEQAPSPQPPSISSFKPEELKPKDKAPLPESVKKASVGALAVVPALPIPKGSENSQQPNAGASGTGTSDNPLGRVKDAFRQFTNTERERLEKRRQAMAKKDKDVKLQDLKKFAQSFKLNTPVPQDLVPILAKDKAKQDEIIEKSKINAAAAAHVKKQPPTSQSTTGGNAVGLQQSLRTPIPAPPSQTSNAGGASVGNQSIQMPDKSGLNKAPIPSFPPRHPAGYRPDRPQPLPANMNLPTAPGPRLLSDKIRHNQQMKQTGQYGNIPVPIPVVDHSTPPPTGPAAMQPKAFSPTGPKPNPRALEFRPSPYAPVFTPGVNAPAPSTASPAPSTSSRATSPSVFFGTKKAKPIEERISVAEAFDPFKRMKTDTEQNKDKSAIQADKPHLIQGFINKPWGTLPTWQVKEENQEKKYTEVFEKSESSTAGATPQSQSHTTNHQNHHTPHPAGHPIPTHISQIPHMPHERHPGPHIPPTFPGPTPFEQDHNRQINSPPNVLPSPSIQNASLPAQFGSPGAHHAIVYPNHPQYGVISQNSQFGGYSRGYAGAPQFMQPPAGAGGASPMVMSAQGQQPIPFMVPGMGGPFIQPQGMYSPHQMHAYPGQPTGPPPPPSGGYPSPGRGAPMMMHQSSQQGHGTPVPAPMMLSMSSGPAGHPPQHNMMRPFHPPHFNQHPGGQHHPQNQYGQYPGGRGGHPHHNSLPGHSSGPSNVPHENVEESK
ncbi:hypothetical protein H072_9242 [Dactylellina haptotyla CBS 200.50]|uniref:LsmAD domain-containing protein n=1 Tax=Dactylellina haptotyla (strain CBS 200.50) TaxID=1284197 RepID=S8BPJ8_DACHA|nr:hypothetical protein H072_9242 [Dactylellina haptotyla CBS 200.50]